MRVPARFELARGARPDLDDKALAGSMVLVGDIHELDGEFTYFDGIAVRARSRNAF